MFKRFFACFLALVLILSLLPGVRAQSAVIASGTAGDDITWTLLENGLLELSGTGAMEDFRSYGKAPWYSNRSKILEIRVGSGITTLGNNAFGGCDRAAGVSLPAGLKRIGQNAFTGCKALRSVTVPEGVTELGNNAFSSCAALAQISLPGSLRTIGLGAFYKCDALTDFLVPEGVTSLGDKAFSECAALETVSLPASLEQIGNLVFNMCGRLTAITVADGNDNFCHDEQYALYDREKTTLLAVPGGFRGVFVIPDTVTTVADEAAEYCSGMTGVLIPDAVTTLGRFAFAYNSLSHVTVPESITVIPDGCFFYNEELASVSIPETVTEIGGSAFGYCEALTEITLPENLTALGEAAFWGCWQLRSIVIPEGIRALESSIFYNCTNLQTVQLPSRLESIDYWCFQDCTSLRDLVLPDTLKTIGANAFEDTTSLTSIVFPASIRELAAFSFRNSGLTEMTFLGDAPALDLGLGLEEYAFGGVTATAYYPMYNPTWTEEVRQDYSGKLTWVAVDNHTHSWQTSCTEPRKCALCGITEGEAPGHDWKGLSCTRCGEARENPFTDVAPESYYFDAVLWAVEKGITAGTDAGVFSPGASCNRAQVVTFLWRAAGSPEPGRSENPFADVGAGSYYEKAVLWAVEKGITAGTDACHFAPDQLCTRAQVVTFLWSAAGKPAAAGENSFTDVPAGAWFERAVLWAKETGITAGVSPTRFGAEATCNRAQVVTFLYAAGGK